jgi:hypothetical protein
MDVAGDRKVMDVAGDRNGSRGSDVEKERLHTRATQSMKCQTWFGPDRGWGLQSFRTSAEVAASREARQGLQADQHLPSTFQVFQLVIATERLRKRAR